jgi:hypothetical protein
MLGQLRFGIRFDRCSSGEQIVMGWRLEAACLFFPKRARIRMVSDGFERRIVEITFAIQHILIARKPVDVLLVGTFQVVIQLYIVS